MKTWLSLGTVFALTFSAYTHASPSSLENIINVSETKPCFSGVFESYDTWVNALASRKKHFDKARFPFSKAEFSHYQSTLDCYSFTYSVEGNPVIGFLVKPKIATGATPTLIFNRGGNGNYGSLNMGRIMHSVMPVAEQGFVVIASSYRGNQRVKYEDFVADNSQDQFGGRDVNDVVALVDILKQLPFADTEQLGVYGSSRGGMQSFLFAKSYPDITAIATVSGSADLYTAVTENQRPNFTRMVQKRIPDYEAHAESALKARSPVYWADTIPDVPVLIIHAKDDERVLFSEAETLNNELNKLDREVTFKIYPTGGHGLRDAPKGEVNRIIGDFFKQALKEKIKQ